MKLVESWGRTSTMIMSFYSCLRLCPGKAISLVPRTGLWGPEPVILSQKTPRTVRPGSKGLREGR